MDVEASDFSSGRASISKKKGDSAVNLEEKLWGKVKSDKDANFEPSMKLLSRIIKVILESNSIGKTSLSQVANINYHRLSKHIEWLEQKQLIESIIGDGKVKVRLTETGREFATLFHNLRIENL